MERFTGTWAVTTAPLEGSSPFLVSPTLLEIPDSPPPFEIRLAVLATDGGDGTEVALTVEDRRADRLRARATADGYEYRFEARILPRPYDDSGTTRVLHALVSRRRPDGGPAPGEDTESYTGIDPGGDGSDD